MTKRRDLRILWNSNGYWTGSGYANFQRDLLTRLANDGWPTAQIAFWGLEGAPVHLADNPKIKVYPKMSDGWGADAMVHHGLDFKANAIFTMQDVWTLNPQELAKIKKWIAYCPIDKEPAPPGVIEKLRHAYKIVTFSNFGKKELQKKGFYSTLIVEGVDTNIFKPMDKAECRKELGLPQDAFFFGMIAANKENPPRKGFQEALEAFKLFHDRHKEAAIIFSIQQPSPGGFPIKGLADYLGVLDRMFFVNDYKAVYKAEPENIVKLYGAMDVLLHPSQTEGFGLTITEANSCGKPVIVNNCTSMPEMIIESITGLICDHGKKRWTNDNAWVFPADVQSLYRKMEEAYVMLQNNGINVAKQCRDHIVQNYNIDTIYKEKWLPFMEELQEEILPVKLTDEKKSVTINSPS